MPSLRYRSLSILAFIAGTLAGAATPAAAQTTPLERGRYLVTTILACGNCHTPLDKGVVLLDTALGAGGRPFLPSFVKGLPARWTGSVSRNVTAHREQGLGAWSDAEIKRAITQGIGRDGRRMVEPMAFAWYAGIRDDDLDALVAYLRTLAPLPR